MDDIQFIKNPTNLINPIRVNPKFNVKEEDFIQPFSDKAFYDNLNEFNRAKQKHLSSSGNYYQNTYMKYKDKAYENNEYKELTSGKGSDYYTYDNYHEKQYVKSLVSKRIYKIN